MIAAPLQAAIRAPLVPIFHPVTAPRPGGARANSTAPANSTDPANEA